MSSTARRFRTPICLIVTLVAGFAPRPGSAAILSAERPIAGSYIVVLHDATTGSLPGGLAGVSAPQLPAAALARLYAGTAGHEFKASINGFAFRGSASSAEALSRDPSVAYVAQDGVVVLAEVQTPTPGWGLDRIDQDAPAPDNAYEYHLDGTGVDLYVIDTGVRSTHVEFGNRVDTADAFTSVPDAIGTEDCHGHGTHVAGVAAASTYGVAKGATIHPVRVLSCYGQGSISDVIAGIDWIAAHYPRPRKGRPAPPTYAVANLSIDAGPSQPLDDAINRAITAGVTFVVAAGNNSADSCLSSPARIAGAITVGASDATDRRATFSNSGTCIDLFAPGTAIPSSFYRSDTDTLAMTGTSVAAPQVAGTAALMLQSNPNATPKDVQATIRSAASRDRLADVGVGSPNLLLYSPFAGSGADFPPFAEFASTCVARQCSFDAAPSADDWGIVGYRWDFGDGRRSTGSTASHRYGGGAGSTVIVTLTVTDSTGQTTAMQHQLQLAQ